MSEAFQDVKARLDEIVELTSDESMPLDDVLALYEEAVQLGLKACETCELDIEPDEADADESPAASDGESAGALDGAAAPEGALMNAGSSED